MTGNLDLAFAMDCTSSMRSFIDSARQNIRRIVEEIATSEGGDMRLALVEYRDHPPQDKSFVTQKHDFTASVNTMKSWLDSCSAQGGGDTPEAVADALQDVLQLSWRSDATKICVLISDAPPHGLSDAGDGFPNGCPSGIDPMQVCRQIAGKGITIYTAGCEPSITPYKLFFAAISYMTGGQYVPLTDAQLLTQVIIGGAQEELSLEQFMAQVEAEVRAELNAAEGDTDEEMEERVARRVHQQLRSKGAKAKRLQRNNVNLPAPSAEAKELAASTTMADVKKSFKSLSERERSHPASTAPASSGKDSYECTEGEMTEEQASRMVHKSLKKVLALK